MNNMDEMDGMDSMDGVLEARLQSAPPRRLLGLPCAARPYHRSFFSRIVRRLINLGLTLIFGIIAAALLVRYAPGFDADVQQLNARLSHETVEALRAQRTANANVFRFVVNYLGAAAHGDFGSSQTLDQPVRQLIGERAGTTARLVGFGLAWGWLVACALAFSGAILRRPEFNVFTAVFSSFFLCLPSAVLALGFVLWRTPAYAAIALVVFPNIFRYARNVLARNYESPHVITALAKGLGPARVFFRHVLPVSAAPLIALAGVSVSIALGAAIPIEALCGIPGIGQLAWQAALGRDLPLLVSLTVIVTIVTLGANLASDLLNEAVA